MFLEEVFHRGNVDALSVAFSENHVAHGSGCLPEGERKAISKPRETVVRMRAALPDLVVTVEKVVVALADEGTVEIACCYRPEGNHRGWLQGLAPIFRRVNVGGMDVYRISGGRIVESPEGFDALGMLGQLGVPPDQGRSAQGTMGGHRSSGSPAPARDLAPPRVPTTANRAGWSSLALSAAFLLWCSVGSRRPSETPSPAVLRESTTFPAPSGRGTCTPRAASSSCGHEADRRPSVTLS